MKFKAIIMDPPWQYSSPRALVGNGGRGSDGGRAAAIIQADVTQHYSTMSIEQIKAIKIPAAKNSLLFLHTPNPFLADGSASAVCRALGFHPTTVLTWAKVKTDGCTPSMKSGHWFRSASEHVIFGVRGTVPRPEDWPAIPTWRPHRRLGHSIKPDFFHEYAEKAVVEGPWLEMFARRPRDGWFYWGDQIASNWTPED